MDTTLEYLRMCDECKEIQELWKRDYGDYYFYTEEFHVGILLHTARETTKKPGYRWLPRQDQLQAMTNWGKSPPMIHTLLGCLHNYVKEIQTTGLKSFEQLWLAFVVYKKYNKTWNGETWT